MERRQNFIKPHELAPWFRAVQSLPEDRKIVGDYLLLLVLTGLRRTEAASMRWENVDLYAGTLTVQETKNKEDHTLPLSDFLFEILRARQKDAIGKYVFPGFGKSGYLSEPKKTVKEVAKRSGIPFTPHDLRRTFATVVNNLETTLSYFSIKRLLNHKTQDVTGGYIQHDVERLRAPMQQVTDFILRAAGVKESAEFCRKVFERPEQDRGL
ncbi:MAG: tyrosine-type recombinase/integrase [Burkholderiales bacterium]